MYIHQGLHILQTIYEMAARPLLQRSISEADKQNSLIKSSQNLTLYF